MLRAVAAGRVPAQAAQAQAGMDLALITSRRSLLALVSAAASALLPFSAAHAADALLARVRARLAPQSRPRFAHTHMPLT
jgi:hypothetical protein